MEQSVAGQDIGVGLGTALWVDGTSDVGEIAEKVEAVKHTDEVAVKETLGEAGVPNKLVGVHGVVGVTPSGIHSEVGGELQAPRQFDLGGEAVIKVEDVDGLKIRSVTGGVLVMDVADALDLQFGVWPIGQAQRLVCVIGTDDAV